MKTKEEFLAMSDDDYDQATLNSEAKQCPGCDSFGTHCAVDCPLCEAGKERRSTIPPQLTGRAAQVYLDARRESRKARASEDDPLQVPW